MTPSSISEPLPYIVLGGGGHALVVAYMLRGLGFRLLGFVTPQRPEHGDAGPWLGGDEEQTFRSGEVLLANGIGSVSSTQRRRDVFLTWSRRGFQFPALAHSGSIIARGVSLGDGSLVMAGAVLQPGVQLGEDVLINTRATIDHGSRVGAHSHVATGAVLCGDVIVSDGVHIGAGATVIQGVRIGSNAIVGAGALVLKDVREGAVVAGVPARAINSKSTETGS